MSIIRKLFQGTSRKAPPPKLQLLQLHEHLAKVSEGTTPHEPSNALRSACLAAAEANWPSTGLSSWSSKERAVRHCYLAGDKTHGFLHIDADHENCFFILSFNAATSIPFAYILFDIGAEYAEPVYVCPAISFEGPPTERHIKDSIPKLLSHEDSFAVMELGGGTYMQTYQNPNGTYDLEHQLVNTANHYRAATKLNEAQVIAALKSYAFGKKEWATDIKWERFGL